jgi:hypothetical protein
MQSPQGCHSAWNKIFSTLFTVVLFSLLNACGSGGDDPLEITYITGQFIDGPVAGLDYQCPPGDFHETNANGEFTCPEGSSVTFHLGPITLGPVVPAANSDITPFTLFPDNPTASSNLARLLQSIDANSDGTSDVIVLNDALLAAIPEQVNITDYDFINEVEAEFKNATGDAEFTMVTASQALAQLSEGIATYTGSAAQANTPPQADASTSQAVVTVGDTVSLDASATTDIDGDPLNYTWTLDSRPAGSAAALSDASALMPNFVADVVGDYDISLWVFDGYAMSTARVSVRAQPAQPDSNAALADLTVSPGDLSPDFFATGTSYQVEVPNDVTGILITPVTADVLATVTVNSLPPNTAIDLALGTNLIPVVVTAANGVTTQRYEVTVTRLPPALSSNADLSLLTLSTGTLAPPFSSAQPDYQATVADTVPDITLTATAAHAAASIVVDGQGVPSGVPSQAIDLSPGDNPIAIVVQAEDGTQRNYSLTVTVEQPLANFDATLQDLVFGPVSGPAQLSPDFDPEVFSGYSTTVDYVHTWIDVIPTAAQPGATITVNDIPVISGGSSGQIGLAVGPNTLHLVVTAVAGNAQSYFVTVNRLPQSSDAELSALSLSSGNDTLSPVFAAAITDYSAFVEHSVTEVAVTATTSHQYAVLSVDNVEVTSGQASAALPLNVGDNLIPVGVTAQDGTTTRDYSINVVRADVAEVTAGYLETLTLSEGTLTPVFNATVPSYTSVVPAGTGSIILTPTPLHATSTVTVNAADPGIPVALSPGDNLIDVTVTSGDGTVTKTYTVNVTQGVPAAPQNLQALAGVGEVAMTWDAVNSAFLYTVHYATDPGVTTLSPVAYMNSATGFTFPGVNDVTYYFRVAASNSEGQGALSAEVSAKPQTFIPKNPSVTVGSGQHLLSWSPLDGAESYSIYWNTTGTVTTADTRVDVAGNTSYTHLGLAPGETYYYRVSATAGAVEGDLSVEVSATQASSGWSWVDPLPQGNSMLDVAWGGGRYVAVGHYGTILTSPDGATWTAQVSGTIHRLQSIARSDSKFVAVGNFGTILSSDDGLSWSEQSAGVTNTLTDIIWAGEQFVAIGDGFTSDVLLVSSDGASWTVANPTFVGSGQGIAWDGVQYAVLSSNGFSNSRVSLSTNLSDWTEINIGVKGAFDIAWGNGHFVVAGAGLFYTSPDGADWSIPEDGGNTQNLYAVEWVGDRFLAVGSNRLLTSFDGTTWATQSVDSDGRALQAITSSGGGFVAVGGSIISSTDAASWTLHSSSAGLVFSDILWAGGDNQFVAVGTDTVGTSEDGLSWSTTSLSGSLNDISWNGSVYVAVGSSGRVYSSPDGSNWSERDSGTSQWLEDITWDATLGQFFAVGWNGAIIASPDGVNWTPKSAGVTDRLLGITTNGSRLVAVGWAANFTDASILTSVDGDTWTPRTSSGSASNVFYDVAWGNGWFVIAGLSAQNLLTSQDGITWSVQDFSNDRGEGFEYVTWDGSQFVALTNLGRIFTSSDAANWTPSVALTHLEGVAVNSNGIVAIGGGGVMINPSW